MTEIVIRLPENVEQYKDDIRRFVDAMVYKLGVHSRKGRWEGIPSQRAFDLLGGEVRELKEALEGGNLIEIMLEAADVANYAMIISAIAIEKAEVTCHTVELENKS